MKWVFAIVVAFFVLGIGYDLYFQEYRAAAFVGGVFAVSVLAGVLGSRT